MKRYRVTIMVVCLVLLYLGVDTIRFHLRNPEPLPISLAELEGSGPPREWLTIEGGYVNLLEAINASGSADDADVFLVPLKVSSTADAYRVLFETRDPAIADALRTYYFKLERESQRRQYLEEHQELLFGRRDVTGQVPGYLVSQRNRSLVEKLKRDHGEDLPEEVILFTEGKAPPWWLGGVFMVIMALLGMAKAALFWRKASAPDTEPGSGA